MRNIKYKKLLYNPFKYRKYIFECPFCHKFEKHLLYTYKTKINGKRFKKRIFSQPLITYFKCCHKRSLSPKISKNIKL